MSQYEKLTGFADEIAQDLQTQIDSLHKLGMRFVEMRGVDGKNLIHHDDAKVREIKARLDDAGIALSAMGTPLGKIGITDPFEGHFEEFKRAIEIAHLMDVRYLRTFSFYVPEGFQTDPKVKEEVWKRLDRFVDYARCEDVCLLHENEKGIYGEKAKECREILDAFGGEHYQAIFDFANFVQAGQDTLEAFELLKENVVYVHVKDAMKADGKVVPAGYGDGNVKKILEKLFANGFQGFLSLEPHLFDFVGFAGLERGRSTLDAPEDGKKLSGFETFSIAKEALLNLL